MPTYTYTCKHCEAVQDLVLEMGHDTPTCKDLEECIKAGCPKDDELNRIFSAPAVTWGGVRKSTTRPTDSTSATREKNEKIKKLYNDSYVGMDNYDKEPYEERKKREASED